MCRDGDSSPVVLVYVVPSRYILCTILRSDRHSMRALFLVIDLALEIYIWVLIAAAIFSWLVAFNVVNVRNSVVGAAACGHASWMTSSWVVSGRNGGTTDMLAS